MLVALRTSAFLVSRLLSCDSAFPRFPVVAPRPIVAMAALPRNAAKVVFFAEVVCGCVGSSFLSFSCCIVDVEKFSSSAIARH